MKLVCGSVMRARKNMGDAFLGKTMAYLETEQGRSYAKALAYFYDLKVEELSVVFDEKDKVIYWIGPSTALPPNAKRHSPLTP